MRYDLRNGVPEIFGWPSGMSFVPGVEANLDEYPPSNGYRPLREYLENRYRAHVVVTAGAQHGLAAAASALGGPNGLSFVSVPAPRYPGIVLAARATGAIVTETIDQDATVIAAWPNNPSGTSRPLPVARPEIWDAAYASPTYGWDGVPVPCRVSVWSASKLLGMPALRVGWVVTRSAEIAQRVTAYVEATTLGVPILMQEAVLSALRMPIGDEPRQKILANGAIFRETLADLCAAIEGVPHNGGGMFAFVRVRPAYQDRFDRAALAADVGLYHGGCYGLAERGWWRISMGRRPEYTREALVALRTAFEDDR